MKYSNWWWNHHYRKRLICRVPNSLPCAKRRAHDTQPLCRVPKIKHTANTTHTEKLPLCRVPAPGTHGKNQTHGILLSLLCAVLKTHGKPRARDTHLRTGERRWTEGRRRLTALNFAVCRMGHTANMPLRRVLQLGTRQTWHFAVCFFLAHGKQFENFEFSNSKLFLHCKDIAWYSVLKFGIFVVMFTIYKNCVSVKRIFRMSQILNCKYIK